jgi:MFS family permease
VNHSDNLAATDPSSNAAAPDATVTAPTTRRRSFLLLFAGLVSIGMGQSLMFAILPPVARNLGLSEVQVGAIFAVSAMLWVLSSPFWGRRSDTWGRRPVILIGLLGYAVSMAIFGLVVQASLAGWLALLPAYALMIATRSVFGLFGSATVPAANAYVADRTEPEERAIQLASQSAGFGLGFTLGPGLVSLLLVFGLVAPFYAMAAIGFIAAAAIGLRLPEQEQPHHHLQKTKRMSPLDPRVLPFMLVGIALGVGQATAMQTAGFYAIDVLGMSIEESAQAVGIALMGTAGASLFVQLVIIRLLKPLPHIMMGAGALCGMVAFAILVFGNSWIAQFIAMMLLGFAFGLIRPGTATGASLAVGRHEQGAVAGLMNTTGAIGAVFAPFVGMTLYQLMPRAPYVLDLLLMAAALAFVIWHPRTRPRRQRRG